MVDSFYLPGSAVIGDDDDSIREILSCVGVECLPSSKTCLLLLEG